MLDSTVQVCIKCSKPATLGRKREYSRGLCPNCYDHLRNIGGLDEFPRKTWRAEDLVYEADLLLSHGATKADAAERLGVSWDSITRARLRLKRRAAKLESAMVYTEHVKLAKIAKFSQSIGEFIEWLGTEGVQLMRWTETVDVEPCDGMLFTECRGAQCDNCGGTKVTTVKRSGYAPHGVSIHDMLAKFFDIDQAKIESEKRHMLETLRQRNQE